jgi:hypothetical protein
MIPADSPSMRAAPAAVSRLLVLVFVGLLATGTITYGAERMPATGKSKPAPAAVKLLVVPDVQGKPYVFAKGMLEEAGFAWRVSGSVRGFAANQVVSQSPAPGTRVIDTGAPTIKLGLRMSTRYAEVGVPESAAPFAGTEIRPPHAVKAKQGRDQ